jgi:FkbM family methyltransferase
MKVPILVGIVAIPFLSAALLAKERLGSLVLSHYWARRAGNCTLLESFESGKIAKEQEDNAQSFRASSRVVKRDGAYSQWSTPLGDYWVPAASGSALIYDLSEQKRSIYETRTNIRPGDIVLDAGANVGVFTRKALWAGALKVVAIEPAPENLECLRRNFAVEIETGRVVIYPKGVWDKDDVLKLSVDPTSSARDSFVRSVENAQFIDAPLTTIDKLVTELRLPRVDFIKMDIEGAERKALVGGRETIAKYRPRMALCVYHMQGDEIEVPKLVHEAYSGYRTAKTCLCATDRIQPEVAFFY